MSHSVDEAVDFVLQGRDQQPAASRPQSFALLAAQCGIRRMLSSEYDERAAFHTFHAVEDDMCPVLRVFGVRKAVSATGLLHDCHVTMVRPPCLITHHSSRVKRKSDSMLALRNGLQVKRRLQRSWSSLNCSCMSCSLSSDPQVSPAPASCHRTELPLTSGLRCRAEHALLPPLRQASAQDVGL